MKNIAEIDLLGGFLKNPHASEATGVDALAFELSEGESLRLFQHIFLVGRAGTLHVRPRQHLLARKRMRLNRNEHAKQKGEHSSVLMDRFRGVYKVSVLVVLTD